MKNRLVVLYLILCDIVLTLCSRKIYGSWDFEANPLLPKHWGKFLALNGLELVLSEDQDYAKTAIRGRTLAIFSHPISWILLGLFNYRPKNNFRKMEKYGTLYFIFGILVCLGKYAYIKHQKRSMYVINSNTGTTKNIQRQKYSHTNRSHSNGNSSPSGRREGNRDTVKTA